MKIRTVLRSLIPVPFLILSAAVDSGVLEPMGIASTRGVFFYTIMSLSVAHHILES